MKPTLLLAVSPSSGVPIYRQLMDQIRGLIASGRLKEGELLPSVRVLAQELQINPMTVSKAFSLLEREGVVELIRGQGMRVRPHNPPSTGVKARQEELRPLLQQVISAAYQLSLSREQVLTMLKHMMEEEGRE